MNPRWIPLLCGAALIGVLITPQARAVLLAYDGFETYNSASNWTGMSSTNGGTGWSNNWSGGSTNVTFPTTTRNMDYSSGSVAVDGGLKSLFRDDVATQVLQRSWTTGVDLTNAANAVYVSFLWQTRAVDGATYSGGPTPDSFFQVSMGEGAGDNNYGVYARGSDSYKWSARFANSGTNSSITIAADTIYFVVFKMTKTGTSIWINPSSQTEGTPSAIRSTGGSLSGTSWDGVNTLMIRSAVSAANYNFDELRIGTSFADVVPMAVPEASAFALVAGGAVMAVVAAGRRRRAG